MDSSTVMYFPMLTDVRNQLVANSVFELLVVLVLAGRITTRTVMGSGVGWDDIFVLAAFPCAFSLLIIQGFLSHMGSGYPVTEVFINVTLILKLTVAFQLIYLFALFLVKMGVLFFYMRLLTEPWMRTAVKCTMAFAVVWWASHTLVVFMICQPFAANYDLTVKGTCGNQISFYNSIIITNVVSDFFIMALPIYTIIKLPLRVIDKIGVVASFMIGLAVTVVSIFRLVYVSTVDYTDITGTMPTTVFLAALEPNLAILCVSIPMLRPLFSKYVKSRLVTSKLSGGTDQMEKGVKRSVQSGKSGSGDRSQRSQTSRDAELELNNIYSSVKEERYHVRAESYETSIDQKGHDPESMVENNWGIIRHN